ncbi:hypothetical protein T440DRAFT_467381 [Plenodomus tracheiphilus IPT5]|uniref:Translation initiation factor 3 N-terminal domain-containing protein n=1 Tax=Plenodomus tracheiphilus IPT5 TaxID=1408161 RepID=A0A6A7BA33_9PLEO|nr:hypothetical protein T440DRAFT_467381 [Plenodomus tracheiphilus IPT5]
MPPTHISGTSRALYRVFVAPNLRSTTSIPLLYAPAFASSYTPNSFCRPSLSPRTTVREKKYTKDTRRQALSDYFVIDRNIESDYINLVDADGTFHRDVALHDALTTFNKLTHHLVQVTPSRVDEAGNIDPHDLPTCRVTSKIDLRAQHERKLDLERRQSKGQGAGPLPKSLELNWAIAGGDLKHRLGRLKEFLLEGRKVELTLGPKLRGKKATEEEAAAVIKAIRDTVAECKGATQKSLDGPVGGVMIIVFQGHKVEQQKERQAREVEKNDDE